MNQTTRRRPPLLALAVLACALVLGFAPLALAAPAADPGFALDAVTRGFLAGLASAALPAVVWIVIRVAVGRAADSPQGRANGQIFADLLEAAEPLVIEAEKLHVPGADRAALVRRQLEDLLAEKGIRGDAAAVAKKHIPALIEVALHLAIPKVPAAPPAAKKAAG